MSVGYLLLISNIQLRHLPELDGRSVWPEPINRLVMRTPSPYNYITLWSTLNEVQYSIYNIPGINTISIQCIGITC